MLSVIIPSIRINNWQRVYDSILNSCSRQFEVLFIGPDCNLDFIKQYTNTKYIFDRGSPNRCQQIGLLFCEYKYVTHFADDCQFNPAVLDKVIDILEQNTKKTVICPKYTEGSDIIQPDSYYKLINAYPKAKYINPEWWIFNAAIFNRNYLLELGGWDAEHFDTCCLGHADISARAQNNNANVIFIQDSIAKCEHGHADHKPIEISHLYKDEPCYKQIWDNEQSRIKIDLNNWQNSNKIWQRFI